MKFRALTSMFLLAGFVVGGNAVADDIFLKLAGIPGDSTDDSHRGEIVLKSYSQAVSNPSTGGAGGAGSGIVNCGAIVVTKNLDSSSPTLIRNVVLSTMIRDGLITFRKSGGEQLEYYTVQLVGITVNSVEQADASGGGVLEVIKFKARQFTYTFRTQRPDGSLGPSQSFGFDCVSNQRL
jgi:type VI secretion system secreted protein Hcp